MCSRARGHLRDLGGGGEELVVQSRGLGLVAARGGRRDGGQGCGLAVLVALAQQGAAARASLLGGVLVLKGVRGLGVLGGQLGRRLGEGGGFLGGQVELGGGILGLVRGGRLVLLERRERRDRRRGGIVVIAENH